MSRLIATAALLLYVGTGWSDDSQNDQHAETRDLIVCGPNKPLFVRLHIRIDRSGYRKQWDANIAKLFSELDRDSDSTLDVDEAKRMPLPQQFQNRQFFYFGNAQPLRNPQAADQDKDGKVKLEEFAQYIRDAGGAEFAAQTMPDAGGQSPAIDADIFKRLDSNQDGKLEASEFELTAAMRKLDIDDDETIGLAEFTPLLFSPYAATMQQPTPGSDRIHDLTAMKSVGDVAKSLLDRYADASDASNQKHIRVVKLGDEQTIGVHDLNEDGMLDNNEVMALLKDPPITSELTVWMGKAEKFPRVTRHSTEEEPPELNEAQAAVAGVLRSFVKNVMPRRPKPNESAPLTVDLGTDRIDFAVNVPNNQYGSTNVRIYKQQFSAADQDNNDYLSEQECRQNGFFAASFNQMDIDGDGKIFEPELIQFIDKQERLSGSRTFVAVTDQGHNLFTTIDANGDRRLTRRELMDAAKHIETWDQNDDGAIALSEIPSQLKLTFSQGTSNPFGIALGTQVAQLMTPASSTLLAPMWFRKMDRNRDSELSPREFLGPQADFEKFDTNNDGLVSVDEVRNGL